MGVGLEFQVGNRCGGDQPGWAVSLSRSDGQQLSCVLSTVVPTAAASGIALLVAQVHRQLRPKDSLHQRLLQALQKTFIAKQVLGLLVSLQQLIHRRGPWHGFEAVEFATLEWVDWFNNS